MPTEEQTVLAHLNICCSVLDSLRRDIKGTQIHTESLDLHLECGMLAIFAAMKDIQKTLEERKSVCY